MALSDEKYFVKRLHLFHVYPIFCVTAILKKCGQNMHEKFGLEHWNNSFFKTLLIILYSFMKNNVFVVYEKHSGEIVATFQIKRKGSLVGFSKLAVEPRWSGRGIGNYCLIQIEGKAKECKCNSLRCEVYYVKRGFTKIGYVRTRKYSEIVMEKQLIVNNNMK